MIKDPTWKSKIIIIIIIIINCKIRLDKCAEDWPPSQPKKKGKT